MLEIKKILSLHAQWLAGAVGGQRADLGGASLFGANLGGADLREADLRGANLRRANLSGANLGGADLGGADLREADLFEADLSGANLSGANLTRANLFGANLSGANLFVVGQCQRGFQFFASLEDGAIVLRAGCHTFVGIAAAWAHWRNRHLDDQILHEDCLSLVDRAERMARARGWEQP